MSGLSSYLWKLLEHSLLLDGRNTTNNGDHPHPTHLAYPLQMLTHLHNRRLETHNIRWM